MWFTSLRIIGIRSFRETESINFSKSINLLIGPNNAGKTTILKILDSLQNSSFNHHDLRIGATDGVFEIRFDGTDLHRVKDNAGRMVNFGSAGAEFQKKIQGRITSNGGFNKTLHPNAGQSLTFRNFEAREGENLIVPFLSKRKVIEYSENVDLNTLSQITGNFSNLYSKIDRISSADFQPAHSEYRTACIEILGYPISTMSSPSGKRAAFVIRNQLHIPLSYMGEGVINILGFIVELCLAENQVFIIEEPENDIHPKALKGLLQLMIKKSKNNQFFISTHSNIVTKILGTVNDSKIFKLTMDFEDESNKIPTSKIYEIKNDAENRRHALEELGYEFTDYDLYEGWLFFEESSGEEIVRDYLIPWFFEGSKLQKFRTFSARSMSEIKVKFDDFNNMFVYLHLTQVYKNKAWVIIDAGEEEKNILIKLKDYYLKHGWNESNFLQLSMHDFEEYYPQIFKRQIEAIKTSNDKRNEKVNLLKEVKKWINENPEKAKAEFSKSAKDVIDILHSINNK